MSYEIITRFNINTKKNTYTITMHPNNVIPADHYTYTEKMTEKNMRSLFESLLFGGYQPTNSITQLNYALVMAKKETQERYNVENLSDYIWNNSVYLNDERIYTPVDDYAFSSFIKYLYEKESDKQYYVSDGYYCYMRKSSQYKYYYAYMNSHSSTLNKFKMSYKKAITFMYNFKNSIENMQLVEA